MRVGLTSTLNIKSCVIVTSSASNKGILKLQNGRLLCRTYTRSYYRKESAAVTHKRENSQPIINIEIANNTLYVLLYFISKCLGYSAERCYYNTTLYYSKWCIYI